MLEQHPRQVLMSLQKEAVGNLLEHEHVLEMSVPCLLSTISSQPQVPNFEVVNLVHMLSYRHCSLVKTFVSVTILQPLDSRFIMPKELLPFQNFLILCSHLCFNLQQPSVPSLIQCFLHSAQVSHALFLQ